MNGQISICSAHHSINVVRPGGISHSRRSISPDGDIDILREKIPEPYAAKERKSRTYASVTSRAAKSAPSAAPGSS
jgi:hypothetical protein